LDFFSGSATTAHAVMRLNAEDGGNRKFIMVQLPELTDESSEAYKAGYKNICEIGKERIRRAGEQIKQDLIDKKSKAGLLDDNIVDPETFDNGFKVFKLDSTNIIPWDGTIKFDENTIFSQTEVIKEDRTSLDVLYEIMLKYGVFDKPVEEIKVNGKTMYSIAKGYLIVCLDNNISLEDVKEIGKLKPRNVIFKESGFKNDNDKINATYTLEKLGVEEIKSI
jgi:adenine-specific DNA-methyltransferase